MDVASLSRTWEMQNGRSRDDSSTASRESKVRPQSFDNLSAHGDGRVPSPYTPRSKVYRLAGVRNYRMDRRSHQQEPREGNGVKKGPVVVIQGKGGAPGREGAALLWGLVVEGARLLVSVWPRRDSPEHIALAEFHLEAERARRASVQKDGRG
jgi:hypothetical protein